MIDLLSTLDVRRDGPVTHVRINRPETGNALTAAVLDDLHRVLLALHDDVDARVLVLSGAGDDFSLGGDRQEFRGALADDPTGGQLRVIAGKARRVCDALGSADVVTIARLQGQVIGAGLALAIFCDLRIGTDACRFRLPELALGLPVAWGGALPRLLSEVGAARIRELMITGAAFDAATAERLSILHRVVPESQMDIAVDEWVRPAIRRSAAALRTTKTLLNAYSAGHRMGDTTLLDAEIIASVAASGPLGR